MSTPQPVLPPLPLVSQIPNELRALKRWCGWRAIWDSSKNKWKKPPYSSLTGEAIGPVDKWAAHWLTFDEALAGARQHQLDGVGFVFVESDGFVGVDFDDCTIAGVTDRVVLDWLRWLPTYVERSPSGTGLHVIGKGRVARALAATALPGAGTAKVEVYAKQRYFTFTGQHVQATVNTVADVQSGLDKLLKHLDVKMDTLPHDGEGAPRAMTVLTARKLHADNLEALRHAAHGEGNALLNTAAFFAGRAVAAGALEGTEAELKRQLLDIVTKEWTQPHPEVGARETIRSGWTSGFTEPLNIIEDDYPQVTETIETFNKGFYVVENFGGRCRVCWEEPNPSFPRGKSLLLGNQSFIDFRNRFMNQLIQVGDKEVKGETVPIYKDRGSVWLEHRRRRQYKEVIFAPNRAERADIRNLWHGFAFEPREGACDLYLTHLRENICQGDPTKYDYLISWMSYAVRHPDEQGHVAIVVHGQKGVGKNVFAEGFTDLWGQHAIVVSDQSRIIKNFNAHLRDKCVLVADEAFFAGDRRHEGVLKGLITGNTLQIEAKGVDAITTPNLLHLVIIGNDAWLVPASFEERRFLMLNCGARQQQNLAYFQAINDQLRSGGYQALLHHLMHEVDLTKFNVREAPHTAELREQMVESLRGAEGAWFECLYNGVIPGRVNGDGTASLRTDALIEWARRRERGWNNLKPQHIGALLGVNPRGKKLGLNFRHAEQGDQRSWLVPKLGECRRLWDDVRFRYLWPEDGGEWDMLAGEDTFWEGR